MARRRRRAKGGHGSAPAEPVSIVSTSQDPAQQQKEATKATCHLMRLPAELRNAIYELFLVERRPITISYNILRKREDWRGIRDVTLPNLPAITRTNRKIREETLAIFLGANTFEVAHYQEAEWDPRPSLPAAHLWFRRLTPEQRRLVKEIVFCTQSTLERFVNDDNISFDVVRKFPRSEEAWKLCGGPRLYLTDQEVGDKLSCALTRNSYEYFYYYRIVLEERLASKHTTASSQ
ncbi:hypothetical protein LTS10_003098 [Elasticomyces elasticus]|nr:hypothetical protein LTS10_003098 [Elasticomyces elasticus]